MPSSRVARTDPHRARSIEDHGLPRPNHAAYHKHVRQRKRWACQQERQGRPLPHSFNRLTIDAASIDTGWVQLAQCHVGLDAVAEAQVVAVHERVFTRDHSAQGKTIYDWRHYLSVVQRKPGALRNGAPFTELPDSFRQLQAQLLKRPGGDREMVDVLALVLLHDERLVEQAIAEALKQRVEDGEPFDGRALDRARGRRPGEASRWRRRALQDRPAS